MEICPDKELLQQFLENDLSEDMNRIIGSHIEICNKCQDTIVCLIANEQNLLQPLLTKIHYREKNLISVGKCPSRVALLAYSIGCVDKKHLKLIESHIEKCDKCITELIELQKKLFLPTEIELDMSRLKEPFRKDKDILDIVLNIKGNILELISHTGELIRLTPQFGAVRGKKQEFKNAVVIRKDFKDKDLSVEITINKAIDESGNNLKISLMTLSTESFMPRVDIEIAGIGLTLKAKTNEEGIAKFNVIKTGCYEIKVLHDIITRITIDNKV